MARELILVVLVLAGCRAPEKRDAQVHAGEPPEEERPAMQACMVDADCTVISEIGPNPDEPCCDATMAGVSVSRAYVDWHFKHRQQQCKGVKCPPLAVPGPPMLACGREARCKHGVCGNACPDGPGPGK